MRIGSGTLPTWRGADHPPGWRRVATIDVGDPADIERALDRGWVIGPVYDGGSGLHSEPFAADCYVRIEGDAS